MILQAHSWTYTQRKLYLKRHTHPNVHSSTSHHSQDMKDTSVSINRGLDQDTKHTYDGVLLSHKKERNSAICSNMDGPRDIILREVGQTNVI